jgi:hypothetical protein
MVLKHLYRVPKDWCYLPKRNGPERVSDRQSNAVPQFTDEGLRRLFRSPWHLNDYSALASCASVTRSLNQSSLMMKARSRVVICGGALRMYSTAF